MLIAVDKETAQGDVAMKGSRKIIRPSFTPFGADGCKHPGLQMVRNDTRWLRPLYGLRELFPKPSQGKQVPRRLVLTRTLCFPLAPVRGAW